MTAEPSEPLRQFIVESTEQLIALEADWDNLVVRAGRDELPLTHGWHLAWWRNFGAESHLRAHCFWSGQSLVGIVPMMIRQSTYRRVPIREASNLANGHSPYSDLIFDPGLPDHQIHEMISEVTARLQADITRFVRIPVSSRLAQLFDRAHPSTAFRVGKQTDLRTPLVRVQGTWSDFMATRSQKFRKSIRNKLNRFFKSSELSIERARIQGSESEVISDILEVSSKSWKAREGTDLATLPGSLGFLKELMDRMGKKGAVDAWVARAGRKPIAYELHMRHSGITYPLRADIDEDYRDLSPGSIVEYMALQDLFTEGLVHLYDSCANDYWYLSNWTTEYRDHVDIEVFGKGVKGLSLYELEYRLIPAARWIRSKLLPKVNSKGSTSSH